MAANPFDIMKDIFDGKSLSNYSDQELKNCGFTINRTMSIKYPLQAQSQNSIGIDYVSVIKYWAVNMKGKFTQVPQWIFTATAAKRKEYQKKMNEVELPEKEIMNAFQDYHGLDRHEIQFLVKHKPKEFVELLEAFQKDLKA